MTSTTGPTDGVYPVPSTPEFDALPPDDLIDAPPAFITPHQIHVSHLNHVVPKQKGPKVVDTLFSLASVAEAIRTDAVLKSKTARVRAALAAGGRESAAFKREKLGLPGIVPASAATPGTPIKHLDPSTANGLFGYDIDESRPVDIESVRRDLIATPGVAMVGISASGDAIWAILAGPVASSRAEYRAHWQALAKQLPTSARANNSESSHDFERARAVAHDPDIWLATDPVQVLAGASAAEIAQQEALGRDHNGNGTGYAPGVVDEDDIARLPRLVVEADYNCWLAQLATLRACGFSPAQVEAWSATGPGYQQGEVLRRWDGLPADPPPIARRRFLEATARTRGGTSGPVDAGGAAVIRESTDGPPDYPTPAVLRPYIIAVAESARSSLPTAAAAVLGAVNFAIGGRVDCVSLAPTTHPASLYLIGLSESGWGKSTAFKLAFRAHEDADREIETRWQDARRAANRAQGSASSDLREVRPHSPRGLRADVTLEALTSRMGDTRPSMALASSEGGQLAGGWSLAKAQRILSFSRLNKSWDGDPDGFDRVRDGQLSVYVSRPRLTLCLLGQPQAIEEVVFSREATIGFTARLLVSRDKARPTPITPEWPQGDTAQKHIEVLQKAIAAARAVEDEGIEYDYDGPQAPASSLFTPTPGAEEELRSFKAEADGLADNATAQGEMHLPGYWSRAPEQAARLACTFAGFRQLLAGGLMPQGQYDLPDTQDAIALVRWHSAALRYSNAEAAMDADTEAADAIAGQLEGWLENPDLAHDGRLKLRTAIGRFAGGKARHLRSDAAAKRRIVDILLEHGHVTSVPKSQLFVVARSGRAVS